MKEEKSQREEEEHEEKYLLVDDGDKERIETESVEHDKKSKKSDLGGRMDAGWAEEEEQDCDEKTNDASESAKEDDGQNE